MCGEVQIVAGMELVISLIDWMEKTGGDLQKGQVAVDQVLR